MLTRISENKKLLPQEKRSMKCPTRRYSAPARLTQKKISSLCFDSDRTVSPWIDRIEILNVG